MRNFMLPKAVGAMSYLFNFNELQKNAKASTGGSVVYFFDLEQTRRLAQEFGAKNVKLCDDRHEQGISICVNGSWSSYEIERALKRENVLPIKILFGSIQKEVYRTEQR